MKSNTGERSQNRPLPPVFLLSYRGRKSGKPAAKALPDRGFSRSCLSRGVHPPRPDAAFVLRSVAVICLKPGVGGMAGFVNEGIIVSEVIARVIRHGQQPFVDITNQFRAAGIVFTERRSFQFAAFAMRKGRPGGDALKIQRLTADGQWRKALCCRPFLRYHSTVYPALESDSRARSKLSLFTRM